MKNRIGNPFYGKKGIGFIKDPKKALKGAIYRRTTIGLTSSEMNRALKSAQKARLERTKRRSERAEQITRKAINNMARNYGKKLANEVIEENNTKHSLAINRESVEKVNSNKPNVKVAKNKTLIAIGIFIALPVLVLPPLITALMITSDNEAQKTNSKNTTLAIEEKASQNTEPETKSEPAPDEWIILDQDYEDKEAITNDGKIKFLIKGFKEDGNTFEEYSHVMLYYEITNLADTEIEYTHGPLSNGASQITNGTITYDLTDLELIEARNNPTLPQIKCDENPEKDSTGHQKITLKKDESKEIRACGWIKQGRKAHYNLASYLGSYDSAWEYVFTIDLN